MEEIDYSRYHPTLVAITDRGCAFIYWTSYKLVALHEFNYGKGQMHWFEYLGKMTKEECKRKYPNTPILQAEDSRINMYCRQKIKELENQVTDL